MHGGGGMCVSRCFYPIKSNKDQVPLHIQAWEMQKSQNKYMASPRPSPGSLDRNMWDILVLGWLRK